ncbi:MAG TPA: RNA polymerase sigma-70 factor [Rikenellaceae bacterium]|nr:RNA polymerase sigma-70 factor [Rikenellaceae bacterium]
MVRTTGIDSLFRLYYRPLCVYALHYLKDKDQIEDLVQEAFTAYWMKETADAVIDNPRAYLYTAVRNRCIDAIRRQRRQDVDLDSLEEEILPVEDDVVISDEEAVDNSLREARIWSAIDRLPAKRRRIFLMSRRDGMKYSEIAGALGLSENTVRNQVSRALDAIRQGVRKVILFLMSL